MQHWSQLATRNWRVKRVRTAGALLAIALGVGAVVWVSCCYESVRQTVQEWAGGYAGDSHINIESPLGRHTQFALRKVRQVEELPEVKYAAPLLVQRLRGKPMPREQYVPEVRHDPWVCSEVDYYGLDLEREFNVRTYNLVAGRMLTADDEFACVLEAAFARDCGAGVGDVVVMWSEAGETQYALEIVGLLTRRRITRFQPPLALVRLPVLQHINNKFGFVTSMDVVLHDASEAGVRLAGAKIHRIIRRSGAKALVRSALARMRQIEAAQQQQAVVLGLLSCVAMLTALFIILSTLSMGMLERISQLGLLRCVGMTGGQLATLVFVEVIPLGVLGIVLGIPIGLGLTVLTGWLVPEYTGAFTIAWNGILQAAAAGLATALVAAALPACGALSVSPLEASHPRARRVRRTPLVVAFLLAGLLLTAQVLIIRYKVHRDFDFVQWSATSVVLLYLVYALLAPLGVWLLGSSAVVVVARLVGLRRRLLQDQIGNAVWRSAGICCGLMVGLSLVVAIVVLNTSFKAGWQFPKEFPEAYIWSWDQLDMDTAEAARRIEEFSPVREYTLANALNVIVEESPRSPQAQVLRSATWFLGTDDTFFDLVKLEFIEGDEQTARELLKQGGHILVALDFARSRRKGLIEDKENGISNTVKVWFGDSRWRSFTVAGVIDSPGLDIAAGFFQAESEARVVAHGSVIGTNADLKRYFNIDGVRLALLNLDLPPEPPPPDWPPPRDSPQAAGLRDSYYDQGVPRERRWKRYREQKLLRDIALRLNAPQAYFGSAAELKDRIDSELTEVTYLLTAVPLVALLVAAIGVANLMTANVASRARQLAILRAVGATRGQILRMVIGEALVLGVLGSGLGLTLGLHLALNARTLTLRFWGFETPFQIPWPYVAAAVALTVGLCILAGILPARHASRTNVIDALHVA